MKTKTKTIKVLAICLISLIQSHLMAQNSNAPTQTVCVGDTEPYTLVDPISGPPTANYSYQWSITGGGTFVGGVSSGHSISISWNTVGVFTVTVIATDNATSCQDSPVDVVVTVEDLASNPSVNPPAPICLNDPNPTITATTGGGTGNGIFNWYSDAGLTTLLSANTANYTDPVPYPSPGTYSYWVTEESANGCEGSATQVTITVTPLPSAPTLVSSPYQACFGSPNPLFVALGSGGTNFNWYDQIGNSLATNTSSYISTESNPGTYTYSVEEVVGSCTSPATIFDLTIHPSPAAPAVSPSQITICQGESPNDFIANTGGVNGSFNWYDDALLTNLVGTGTNFTPLQTTPGTYTYWITEIDPITNCTSISSSVVFIINELPLIPIVSASPSATVCDGDPNPTFTATQSIGSIGTNTFNWYDVDPATNPGAIPILSNSLTFTPTQVGVNLYQFWVTETNSLTNCEGIALLFTFEIIPLPAAPVMTPNPIEICFGDANPSFNPSGSSSGNNFIWYDDIGLTNQVGTGSTFTPPANIIGNSSTVSTYSYWVVDQPGTCISPSLEVILQINPLPSPGPIWHNP